ncbi:MAG: polyphosphate:AMP phosphotransferase [Eubacteriales bacterium]
MENDKQNIAETAVSDENETVSADDNIREAETDDECGDSAIEPANPDEGEPRPTRKARIKEAQKRLGVLQQQIKQLGIPVIVLFEGWGASGKGNIIGKFISELDPRGFKVYTVGEATADERRFPIMQRFWQKIPAYGNISIFDRSWYREVSISRVEHEISKRELDQRFREILDFETQLSDDGYLILKFFLRLSRKEQRKRFSALEANKATRWRVTEADWKHHRDYDEYLHAFDEMIDRTTRDYAPWIQIDAADRKHAVEVVLEKVINALETAIEDKKRPSPAEVIGIRTDETIVPRPIQKLSEVDLTPSLDAETYKAELDAAQNQLFELHNRLYQTKTPLIIVYEGWDAAGKGGNIKRLTDGLDPRGYEVIPIAAPTREEITHQYLWRFWKSLPKDGHIAIYDRSWYGRVMVERIEGFCTEAQWKRAFDEMNHFEESLRARGAIIIKFWLHIDSEEQLERFTDRQNTPEKQWKITDEDWRNRDKWDKYEQAVDDMLKYTNTEYAPWVIVESNDKKYARLKALREVIAQIEKYLK